MLPDHNHLLVPCRSDADGEEALWHMLHDAGDEEDLELVEVEEALRQAESKVKPSILKTIPQPGTCALQDLVGQRTSSFV